MTLHTYALFWPFLDRAEVMLTQFLRMAAAVLEKMFFRQPKTFVPKTGKIPDCKRTSGPNPSSMPERTLFGHEV
jgi:hypothetical protein